MKYYLFGIGIIIFFGVLLFYILNTSSRKVILGEIILTKEQYNLLKTNLIQKVSDNKTSPMTIKEANQWLDIVKNECKNFVLDNVTDKNLIQTINNKLSLGKC